MDDEHEDEDDSLSVMEHIAVMLAVVGASMAIAWALIRAVI